MISRLFSESMKGLKMNRILSALVGLGLAQAAFAIQTDTYGWEEDYTVLGVYGNGVATL